MSFLQQICVMGHRTISKNLSVDSAAVTEVTSQCHKERKLNHNTFYNVKCHNYFMSQSHYKSIIL